MQSGTYDPDFWQHQATHAHSILCAQEDFDTTQGYWHCIQGRPE